MQFKETISAKFSSFGVMQPFAARCVRALLFCVSLLLFASSSAQAQTLYWSPDNNCAMQNSGGSGTWNLLAANFCPAFDGGNHTKGPWLTSTRNFVYRSSTGGGTINMQSLSAILNSLYIEQAPGGVTLFGVSGTTFTAAISGTMVRVDSGSTLTISGNIGTEGTGSNISFYPGYTNGLGGTVNINGLSQVTGWTSVAGSTMTVWINNADALGSPGDFATAGTHITSGGTLIINGVTIVGEEIGIDAGSTLSGNNGTIGAIGKVILRGALATLSTNSSNSLTVDGVVSSLNVGDGLRKTGLGAVYLTNNNTYSGATVVDAGVLVIGDSAGTAASGGNPPEFHGSEK